MLSTISTGVILVFTRGTYGSQRIKLSLVCKADRGDYLGDKRAVKQFALMISTRFIKRYRHKSIAPSQVSVAVTPTTIFSSLEVFLAASANRQTSRGKLDVNGILEAGRSKSK